MNEGYGARIYKSGRRPKLHYFIFPLLIVVVYFIFLNDSTGIKKFTDDFDGENERVHSSNFTGMVPEDPGIEPSKITVENSDAVIPQSEVGESPGLTREEVLSAHNRAISLIKNSDFRKAIGEYEKILEFDRRYRVMIGMCHYWMGEFEEAETVLLDAEDNGYFPFQTKKYLALSLYRLNELQRSLEYAESALEINSDKELVWLVEKLRKEEAVMKNYKDTGAGNFLIQFSREEHHDIRDVIADHLKEAYREIGKQLDYFPNRQFPVILYNERDFFDVTRAPGWAGGLYDGKIRIPVRGLSGQADLLRKVIFHEYTHALISEITVKCPLWLNEGLAEYFSGERADPGFKSFIPLNMIEKGFPAGNIRTVSAAYLTSLAVVEYLIDRYGIYSITELLHSLNDEIDLGSAFRSVFFTSYDEFVSGWHNDQ